MEDVTVHRGREQAALARIAGNRYVTALLRLVLGATFLLSSIGKLIDIPEYSVMLVMRFNILPLALATAFGWSLPFIELAVALGLLFGVLTRLAALGAAILGLAFLGAKIIILSRGMDIDCGCFGPVVSTMASATIYLDPAIFLMSLLILLSPPSSRHWLSLEKLLPARWREKLNLIW